MINQTSINLCVLFPISTDHSQIYAIISLAKCHVNHGTTTVNSLIEQLVKYQFSQACVICMLILQVQDFVTVSLHEFNTLNNSPKFTYYALYLLVDNMIVILEYFTTMALFY